MESVRPLINDSNKKKCVPPLIINDSNKKKCVPPVINPVINDSNKKKCVPPVINDSNKKKAPTKPPMIPNLRNVTHVVQVPKEQIYRVPPPENALRYQLYRHGTTHGRRSSLCCRRLLWIFFIVVLALIVAGVLFYFVFAPNLPIYSVTRFGLKGANITQLEFALTVLANNPNTQYGLYYRNGSDITVEYSYVTLGHGNWPTFYHAPHVVTEFAMTVKGSGIRLSDNMYKELMEDQDSGEVPLKIVIMVPVAVKIGVITSLTVEVKIECALILDNLSKNAGIISEECAAQW